VTRWGYDVSLWFLVHLTVPGANAFRAVGRIAFAAYLFGLVGGLVGVQALVTERISRPGVRAAVFVAIAALMILEQVRPFPESFDKREEFLNRAESLIPQLRDVDAAYILYDEAMPDYRHEIAAMWAGLWAKTPVMNGFSGTQPPGYPGIGARPPVEELVRLLGPNWRGKLAVIEWGPPVRRRVYQVEPGEEPSNRVRRIEWVSEPTVNFWLANRSDRVMKGRWRCAMTSAYHTTTTVLPGNRIEITAPDLREGEQVQVVVIPVLPATSKQMSGLDIIESLQGHRLFQSPEEVDRYINEERDSWDR
jgi:hypothetical protein